ncbi:MAG: alpha/beta fold hydrolase [Thiolinea sp.]
MEYATFSLGDITLQSGDILPDAQLTYQTVGELNAEKDNVVLLPTFYTGSHIRNQGFFGTDRAIDPAKHFIVSINMFGNSYSSSPSNTRPPADRGNFPLITLYDNVACQQRLLSEVFGIEKLKLVMGWSMAGCQAFQWAAQFPDRVENILPVCASAKTSPHNWVFLEGVKAALQADANFQQGFYTASPEKGLKAFARVYAGWAYSQTFYREKLHRHYGFETAEALLQDWEQDHLDWDANNLLAKLATWQAGDISANGLYEHDFQAALRAIKARTIVIACDNDLYFQPADNALEVEHIPDGELRVYESPWGHCVASPGNGTAFADYLDDVIRELIG